MRTLTNQRFQRPIVLLAALCVAAVAISTWAQTAPVTAQVEIVKPGAAQQATTAGNGGDNSDVVVWLSPLDHGTLSLADSGHPPQLIQRNKAFEPHVMVVQAGTLIQFPNKDPFFHNVFSLFNGKRFDLGLYEAGSSKSVRFDRVGVSFLFCNIHEEMSAIIVAVDTPYFGLSDHPGHVIIPNVPDGRYEMHAWNERSSAEDLKALDRAVTISNSSRTLEPIRVVTKADFTLAHKNKYGEDYVPPPSAGYIK